jgi:hypothetical protein
LCSSSVGNYKEIIEADLTQIQRIRQKFLRNEYEFTLPHFFEEMADDGLTFKDIEKAILTGDVRRRFKRDLRGTRYEIVGCAIDGREIGINCRIKSTGRLLLITTYAIKGEI